MKTFAFLVVGLAVTTLSMPTANAQYKCSFSSGIQ
ncbi:UNVERIFIED_ORG: hypothetical protein M2193_002458 [Bradyrhizobium japonicum]|jgi:hypothetical protein